MNQYNVCLHTPRHKLKILECLRVVLHWIKKIRLYINFHRLAFTQGSSYINLPEGIQGKKAVLNPQNDDEECFKWAVIAAIHHKEIKHHPERISMLKPYENQYN